MSSYTSLKTSAVRKDRFNNPTHDTNSRMWYTFGINENTSRMRGPKCVATFCNSRATRTHHAVGRDMSCDYIPHYVTFYTFFHHILTPHDY